MLKIRVDQKNVFREEARRAFLIRLYNYLHERVPGYFADLDYETALAHVDSLVTEAQELGFRTQNQIRRFTVAVTAATGHAGDYPPKWLSKIASRPHSSAPMRLLDIEDALIHFVRSPGGKA